MADDRCRTGDDGCEVRSGVCGDRESSETTPQAPSDEMSQEDWDYVCGPSRPGSEPTMIAGVSGGCEDGEPERSKPTQGKCPAPQNVQNEANQESTQSSLPLEVESSVLEPQGRKRSQMEGANVPRLTPTVASESGGCGERRVAPGSCGEGETVVSSQWPAASESGGREVLGASRDSEEGEPERSEATQGEWPAPHQFSSDERCEPTAHR